MKVTYEIEVLALCPADGRIDHYACSVETHSMIRAEEIRERVDAFRGEHFYQEDLTQRLADALQAQVTTTGWHYGVKTICQAAPSTSA